MLDGTLLISDDDQNVGPFSICKKLRDRHVELVGGKCSML